MPASPKMSLIKKPMPTVPTRVPTATMMPPTMPLTMLTMLTLPSTTRTPTATRISP